jgi:hypothetical protein
MNENLKKLMLNKRQVFNTSRYQSESRTIINQQISGAPMTAIVGAGGECTTGLTNPL